MKKLTNEARNITLLLIQHSDGLTFKSYGCFELSWLYLLCLGGLFYWVQKGHLSIWQEQEKGQCTAEGDLKTTVKTSVFSSLVFPQASACMVLTKGHSSQKHKHFHRCLCSFLFFSAFFFFFKQAKLINRRNKTRYIWNRKG